MTILETESMPAGFEDQTGIDAQFDELDKEKLRAADFVANIARVIKDIRSRN
jgi:hypothetical protein